jgi:SAM-dependent methyltransferase
MNGTFLRLMLRKPRLLFMTPLLQFFNNKSGVVIGGHLRWNFKGLLQTAKKIINVDNCPVYDGKPADVDYVAEASDLFFAEDESLDFVCSSHVLEHLANPLKAIVEWKRALKKGGIIYIGVPDKRRTFDRKRDRTPLSHLIEDFNKDVDQADQTHVSDYIEKWDRPNTSSSCKEDILKDAKKYPQSLIHHHVWITEDLKEIFEYMNLKIRYGPILRHGTIHIIGQKIETLSSRQNKSKTEIQGASQIS